ncbi:MAG: TauD/TfdA family dioxygenase [Rhodospirillaceae bacterium]
MSYEIRPLAPGFGAEVFGVDLARDGGDNLAGALVGAWRDAGGLLVIHDQDISTEDHIRFAGRFGPLFGAAGEAPLQDTVSRYIHPDFPEIYRVSNQVDAEGKPTGRKGAGTYWHSDVSFRERPAQASILLGKQVPPVGGDTVFADQARAYEALSDTMKDLLAPLHAWHDFEVAARTQYAKPVVVEADMEGANRARHPLVRTKPETGKKSIFANPGFTSHIDGMTAAESAALLKFLYDHSTRPEFLYRHRWRRHDMVIWDNRSLMHYAVMDYPDDQPRYMERCTVIGERPV